MEQTIVQIIDKCQMGCGNNTKNIKLLQNVYNTTDFKQFLESFIRILLRAVQEDFQNPCVKRLLDFLAKFVGYIASDPNTKGKVAEKDPPAHPFLRAVVENIIKYHTHPAQELRHNICNFLALTLQNLGENAVLDSHIIDLIQNSMLENIQDYKPVIRQQAILALTRLQDPLDPECPVIRSYIKCLRDSNHTVRRDAVKRIAPNAITIPKIKERTRDRDANVRCAAFIHLADIGIKHCKIVHRQFILKSGFTETNPHVKKIFLEYLLPKWLTALNGSYLALLHAIKLDAEDSDIVNTEELSSQIMQVFFKTEPIDDLIEALPLDENKVVPEGSIKSELAHYWNIVVRYLRQSDDLEEILETIIPELTVFCNYVEQLISSKFSKTMDYWEYLECQYLLYHLFDIAEHYDLCEEVGRRTLDKLIKTVLKKHRLQPRLLNKIVQISSKLASNEDSFTSEICQIISDIWQPMIDQPPDEHDQREKDFRIAEITVKLNILEGDLEDAVTEKDFVKAQKLTLEIAEYNKKMELLKSDCVPVEQVRVNSDDPETLCWCLDLFAALLIHGNIKKLSSSLILCRQEFLMPLVASKDVEIGWRAFKCLSAYCIFDQKFAVDQLKTICVPIASYRIIPNFNKTILMDSIAIITDLIRLYGTELFNTDDESTSSTQSTNRRRLYSEDVGEVDPVNNRLTVDFIVDVFLDMLDDENNGIRNAAVTAVAKLMLNDFPVNPMVMTRLILKWYNPLTRMADGCCKDIKEKRRNLNYETSLQQTLGVIIKAYSEQIPNSKEVIGKSIVPILINIAEAPRTSPLAEIDIDNVIRFLAAITDTTDNNGLMHTHTDLARTLIQEISLRPSKTTTIYFAKMLNFLIIVPDNSPAVKELIANAELILEKECLDKAPRHHVVKFIGKLNSQADNSTTNSTIATTNAMASTTGNEASTTVSTKRLSPVLENDDEEKEDALNNTREEAPCKKRRIDLVLNVNRDRKNGATPEHPITINDVDGEEPVHINQKETRLKKNKSSSSDSDVVPSRQPDSELGPRRTRRGAKLDTPDANPKSPIKTTKGIGGGIGKSPSNSNTDATLSASSAQSTSSSSNNFLSQERITRSTRSDAKSTENNKNTKKRANKQVGGKKATGKKINHLRSTDSSEQSDASSPATSSQQEVKRGSTRKGANTENNISKKNTKTPDPSKRRNKRLVGKNLSKSYSYGSSKESSKEPQRSTSAVKSREVVAEIDQRKDGVNGLRKLIQKENHSVARKMPRARLDFVKEPTVNADLANKNTETPARRSQRNKLEEKQEENILMVNNVSKPVKCPSKMPQVKRKKIRRARGKTELKDISTNLSDTSVDQTLHTIVEPSSLHVRLLTDDSFENVRNRSSRRLQVVVSETSSDESPTRSIRKSNRKSKTKMFKEFI